MSSNLLVCVKMLFTRDCAACPFFYIFVPLTKLFDHHELIPMNHKAYCSFSALNRPRLQILSMCIRILLTQFFCWFFDDSGFLREICYNIYTSMY
jgi:hypothetical protein